MRHALKTNIKLNNIQVLRAFAAVSVVYYHTGFVLGSIRSFGSYGVDVFFVISGYIMARILDASLRPNLAPGQHPGDFFLRRRLLRIVPPYWTFTLLLYFASLRLPALMGNTRPGYVDLFKSLFFIPFTKYEWVIQPLLFIGWSLNYEMFFYIALAIGVFLHKRFALRFPSVILGAGLVLLTMLACMPFTANSVLARFYSRDLSLEFLLGIASYYLCRSIPDAASRRFRFVLLLLCLGSAALLIAVQGILPATATSRVATLGIPALILVTSVSLLSQAGWDTRLAGLVLLGDASYILYLVHPYCELSIDRILAPHYAWLHREAPFGALLGISLSVILALLIHRYIERPALKYLSFHYGGRHKPIEFTTPAQP